MMVNPDMSMAKLKLPNH